ncbi:iron uptake system protein EfeO [Brucella intermedia]|uniref:iron uptake system protein EfeO n=1 Tax=Brucella intermedia TaxID=94625 RepID=UPI00209BB400|nr:iron uptake system protein EfeO [Brucella intermedia]MCO7736564.1 iron uptake system protein EfeO [Brucella intermedia]WLF99236.1 iron uptake system protein EfeO [Brucella intermedia]
MTNPRPTEPMSRNLVRLGLALAVLLLLAAGAAFYYASRVSDKARHAEGGDKIQVAINAKSCEPNELTVPAGRSVFEIINKSDRTVEWEILDGVMVLEERENIAPGFKQTITAKLAPGEYQITCGLLSNPRGKLTVTATAASEAEKSKLPLTAFIGALAEYQIYLTTEVAEFQKAVAALSAAIASGNLEAAHAAYGPARAAYARISPVSEAFSDLDTAINARADYFEKREKDAGFGGLHRIEYGLFEQKSVDGLAAVAGKLEQDATVLKERIRGLRISPDRMMAGTASALNRFASTASDEGEDRYAHTDLQALSGLLEGAIKTADVLRPIVEKVDQKAFEDIDKDAASIKSLLGADAQGNGFKAYDSLSPDEKAKFKDGAAQLAAQFTKLRDQLGVD